MTAPPGPTRLMLDALGAKGRMRLALLAALTVLGGVAEFASLAALAALLRQWLAQGGGGAPVQSALLVFGGAVLVAGAVRALILVSTQKLTYETAHRLLLSVQRRVLARSWQEHSAARSSGPLAAMQLVEHWLYSGLLPLLGGMSALILGTAILAGLLWVDARAAVMAAALLGTLFLAATLLVRPAINRAGDAIGDGFERRLEFVQDNVGGLRELILAGARPVAAARFAMLDRQLAGQRAQISSLNGLPRIIVENLGLLALIGLAWWLSARSGGLAASLPTLGALALGAQRLLPQVQALSQAVTAWSGAGGVHRRIAAMLEGDDLAPEPEVAPLPFTAAIQLAGVAFGYEERSERVLDGIDLTIRKGERIALTGRNGSGKSTLADIVMGLLPPTEGVMLVDGQPISPATVRAWQRNIAHVPQAPFLLDSSILDNVAFMAEVPDRARAADALRQVGLEEMVARLPHGLDTRIGARGQLLSGGQRQRLALARALYTRSPLLVLDEATSALDPESEAAVLATLDRLQAQGTTILLIAHRAAMLEHCQQVVRIADGRLTDA